MRTIVRETGLVEQLCSCGIGHPTREGIDYMSKSTCSTKKVWEVHGCCMIPGHCWLVDRDNDKRQKRTKEMLSMQREKRSSNKPSVSKLRLPRSKSRRDKKTV